MNGLSKDVVNHLAVDEVGEGERVDNFLLRILKRGPKSHIYRNLRSGGGRVNSQRDHTDPRPDPRHDTRTPPVRVELPLARFVTGGGERQVRVEHASGRMARTVFYRRRIWPRAAPALSLLEAELATGRTHQIRVHLTHLGFPLAGDDKYGDFAWNKALAKQGLKRMFLLAWRLSLPHPTQN